MSKIKSKGTSDEVLLGKVLWSNGIRYRKQYNIIGKPDFVIVSKKIAIFCDGAFWHGYKNMTTRIHRFKNNQEYWNIKIRKNIARDIFVTRELKKIGWNVIRFWDFDIKKSPDKCAEKVLNIIKNLE